MCCFQALSFSEETQDDIDVDLLDDVALCQFQRLTVVLLNSTYCVMSYLIFRKGSKLCIYLYIKVYC